MRNFYTWTWVTPLAGLAVLGLGRFTENSWYSFIVAASLLACVQAAVHHAEVIAERIGEPFGTLILALAVTIIEVALIVSIMRAEGESALFLARDSVFATLMIVLNGIVGMCLLFGGAQHREQTFEVLGVSATLATLATLAVVSLILPNYTTTVQGPVYSSGQLAFVGCISLVLYGVFLVVQTVRHRDYFLNDEIEDENVPPTARKKREVGRKASTGVYFLCLCGSLAAVVLLGKSLSPAIARVVANYGAPKSAVGVLIALVVLLPEGTAALRAARRNRLQTSLNLSLGSALATMGLTIPAVAIVSLSLGLNLGLGLDMKGVVLLSLTLLVSVLSLGNGKTTVLQGAVHLVIFAIFLFTTVFP